MDHLHPKGDQNTSADHHCHDHGHHHDHHHGHHHHHHHHGTGNIKVAFFLNLGFTIIEIIGGFLTNSMAILSDALHDFGDTLALGMAWYFQKLANKESDKSYSYGYRRFPILGALINSVILIIGSIFILSEAIPRLLNPQQPDARGMILLALLGVIVNGAAVLKLRTGKSINEQVVSLHLLEDVLGWVAVLIGSAVMYFFDVPIIDPILSVAIALFILYNVAKGLKFSLGVIMQGIPYGVDPDHLKKEFKAVPKVKEIQDLRLWSMDGSYHVLTVQVLINRNLDEKEITTLKNRLKAIAEGHGIGHTTIEFETARK